MALKINFPCVQMYPNVIDLNILRSKDPSLQRKIYIRETIVYFDLFVLCRMCAYLGYNPAWL